MQCALEYLKTTRPLFHSILNVTNNLQTHRIRNFRILIFIWFAVALTSTGRVVGQVRKGEREVSVSTLTSVDKRLTTAGFDATQGQFPATITDIQATFVATKSDVFNKIFSCFSSSCLL